MEQKKQTGFSLFPTPPTPPARRSRARTTSSSASSTKLFKSRPSTERNHGEKPSTSLLDQSIQQPTLIPAPLTIRKSDDDIPPVPAFPPFSPLRSNPVTTVVPKTPESKAPQLPAIPQSSPIGSLPRTPTGSLPRTPTRNDHLRARSRLMAIAEFVELDAISRNRASSRLSQWLDLEDGEVDRRRLSMYLGSVLDNTFEVPVLNTKSRDSISLYRRLSKAEVQCLMEKCECPPDSVICHCSSPEFQRFRDWTPHKQNSSISSTACILGVPRARFQSAFFNLPEVTIAELPSTPGLSFDTDEDVSEQSEWASPRTPCRDDVFGITSTGGKKSYSSKYVVSSPSSRSSTPSKYQSFSRPFRPDSTPICMTADGSDPTTPSRTQSRHTGSKSPYLTSISTMSSFDFDFEMKSRRESLLRLQQADEKEQSNHLRSESNQSNSSETSQCEFRTATASVALSGFNIKPVLINNTTKRVKNPSSSTSSRSHGSTSTSASIKTSTSSVSIPDYWQKYDAGIRARSRATTVASTTTADSTAFSAMLALPMLPPKSTEVEPKIVVGNAFAQRSNTIAVTPSAIPPKELDQFDFGTTESKTDTSLGRSNTMPILSTSVNTTSAPSKNSIAPISAAPSSTAARPNPSPTTQPIVRTPVSPIASPVIHSPVTSPKIRTPISPISSPKIRNPTSPTTSPKAAAPVNKSTTAVLCSPTNEHVNIYSSANARLKAYFSSVTNTANTSQNTGSTGLGLVNAKPAPLVVNKARATNRDDSRIDSGVFGRMGDLGDNRNFSEPQYYRYTALNRD